MSFSRDIKNWTAKVELAANLVLRGTALDLAASIIKRTPVDTGRLIGNWQTEINGFPTTEVNSTAGAAINKAKNVTSKAKAGDSIYIVNNLSYAPVIERGDAHREPVGMVRLTIQAFKRVVAANAKKARK